MKLIASVAALSAAAVLIGGCAGAPRPALAPKPPPPQSLGDYMDKVRYLSARPAARPRAFGTTVEMTDPGLAAALLAESIAPSAEAHIRVASEYRRLHILDAAYERFNRALRIDPQSPAAYEGLARTWRDWRLPALALADAYRAVYFAPQSASAHNTLGTVLDALDRSDAARDAYRSALKLEPRAAWAMNNLCYLDFRLGRFADARRQCEAAIQAAPAMAAAHNNLALTLAAQGDLDGARRQFLSAGDKGRADFNMGIVYLARREYALAAHSFADAVTDGADSAAAQVRAREARRHADAALQ